MKTLSFISGVVLSMAIVAPASAYIGLYQPRATVRMTYSPKTGVTRTATTTRTTVQQYRPQVTAPMSQEWPEWIGMPSWIGR